VNASAGPQGPSPDVRLEDLDFGGGAMHGGAARPHEPVREEEFSSTGT
jgi:hypothetical protein